MCRPTPAQQLQRAAIGVRSWLSSGMRVHGGVCGRCTGGPFGRACARSSRRPHRPPGLSAWTRRLPVRTRARGPTRRCEESVQDALHLPQTRALCVLCSQPVELTLFSPSAPLRAIPACARLQVAASSRCEARPMVFALLRAADQAEDSSKARYQSLVRLYSREELQYCDHHCQKYVTAWDANNHIYEQPSIYENLSSPSTAVMRQPQA